MTKKQVVHLKPELLCHMVKRWSTETHTFICAWGEFTPTLEDVANIMHLPITGNIDPFHYVIPLTDADNYDILKKGSPTSPGKAFRFNEWIKHFWQKKQEPNYWFEAMLCLWLGCFIFCVSRDTFSCQVISWAMAIACGHVVLLSSLFLGFLQIFMWEHIKGLKITLYPSSAANSRYCFIRCASNDVMKHFKPQVVKNGPPSKPDASLTPMKLKSEGSLAKPKIGNGFFFILCFCCFSIVETDGDEEASEGLAVEESSNTSAESDPRSGGHPQASLGNDTEDEDNGRELSCNDDSKAVEDVDLDEVDGFLNDDELAKLFQECFLRVFSCACISMLVCWNFVLDSFYEMCCFVSPLFEWASWLEVIGKLKHNIANVARVLNSIEELIPLSETFSSLINFRGVKVHFGLAKALGKFFERAGDGDVSLIGLSLFMRGMIFEELVTLLYGMEHTSPLEVIKHKLLCWRDMITDVATLGVPMGFLVEKLGEFRDTMFGLQLEKEKGVEKLKLKKLAYGSSKEIADCLQLAADQLHAETSSWSSERWSTFALFSSSNSRSFHLQSAQAATSHSTSLNVKTLVMGIIISIREIASNPYTKEYPKLVDNKFPNEIRYCYLCCFPKGDCFHPLSGLMVPIKSSPQVSLEPSVARASAYLLVVPGICSNNTCLKLTMSFSAIIRYGAKVISFIVKLPWTWLRTKFESSMTRILLAPISLSMEKPMMKASYSATLFVHGNISLKDRAVAWPSRLTSTMPARPVVVEKPSKCMTYGSFSIAVVAISGSAPRTSLEIMASHSLGNNASMYVTAWPLIALNVIYMIWNSESLSNQQAKRPDNIGLVNKYFTKSDFAIRCSLWARK
ncbi:hypothetical protein D8674_005928 [Pyrus ussuriensis x Pyrus communis]|uniref:Aminotransferase-like plant mobile domain-containing protein n=1 Tax=Pyrus ussuriensis x Pyrus communis TaxID=2448454 RepID=A0A5N5FX81_9ROSA|nr:hypothetical protein D8674_005928 [Pyrus ussuriensis x Pyrus communis]